MPTPPAALQKPNRNHTAWLLRRIWDRINRDNNHFMGVIVGEEGSGKSHTALKIANNVDPSFGPDRVIFDVSELLKRLQDGDHDPGQFYVLDEAGVQLGRRTWQERGQVLANQALQLIRNHNLGLVFTLPRLSELDSQAQGRLQAFYELTEKEPGEYVRGKWKFLDPDRADTTGKIYRKYPRRREDGVEKRITEIGFTPPAEALVEPYEERKSSFQEEFYGKAIDELDGRDGSEGADDEEEKPTLQEIADRVASNGVDEVISRHGHTKRPYVSDELLRAKEGLSQPDATAVKELLEKRFDEEDMEELLEKETPSAEPI
jgi:hypothetical protein